VKSFFKDRGRWVVLLTALAALGLGGLGIFAYYSLRNSTPTVAPVSEEPAPVVREAVTALGRIEPQDGMIRVAAPSGSANRVGRMLVREGDRVQAGQVIAEMDNRERLAAAVLQAEAQVREAEQRLAQVQTGAKTADIEAEQANVARLAAELQQAERDYDRFLRLYQSGAISEADLDDRRLRVETIARQLDQARQQVISIREVRPVDVQLAQSQVEVALTNLERARADLETSLVRAPISGQIIKIHAEAGEQVGNNGILEMGNTEQMYVIAEVYETDINQVRLGQPVTVTSSTFPETLTGTVEYIGLAVNRNEVFNSDPAADVDTRVVEVKIRLNQSEVVSGLTNLQVNVAIDIPST
jgi:HlyD family secretion protein